MALHWILYRSLPVDLSLTEQLEIAADAAVRNGRRHVSGYLIMGESFFVQFLEGKEEKIRTLFEKIRRDPRHEQVEVLAEGTAEARRFGAWAMGFSHSRKHAKIFQSLGDVNQGFSPQEWVSVFERLPLSLKA